MTLHTGVTEIQIIRLTNRKLLKRVVQWYHLPRKQKGNICFMLVIAPKMKRQIAIVSIFRRMKLKCSLPLFLFLSFSLSCSSFYLHIQRSAISITGPSNEYTHTHSLMK